MMSGALAPMRGDIKAAVTSLVLSFIVVTLSRRVLIGISLVELNCIAGF